MSFELSEAQIQNILQSYKNKREREKQRYQEVKDSEDFKSYNRNKARQHYINNKDKYKERYNDKKDFIKARNSYYYYKKTNNIEKFKNKHPERYELLEKIDYFNVLNPSSSSSTE
jgi:hypothetical protein